MARGNYGQRQEKDWSSMPSIDLDFTSESTVGLVSVALGVSSTVLRMLGEYRIQPTVAGTFVVADACKFTIGVGVVSTDAFTAGGAAFPDPAGSPDFPWLYWAEHTFGVFDSIPNLTSDMAILRRRWESRAMRKMKAVESLTFIVQYSDIVGLPPFTFSLAQTRVLFGGI